MIDGYNLPAVNVVWMTCGGGLGKRAGAGMRIRKSRKQRSDEKSRLLFDLGMPASRDVQQESTKEGTGETLEDSARATAVGSNIDWKAGAELAEQGILAGTSAFTAAGWEGTFYPAGMKAAEYLRFYATRFRTVEVDSTFYGTPKPERVHAWYEKTPADFVFAVKVPQVITHEKALVDCEAEMDEFLQTMALLHEKLGPMLLQFGYFGPSVIRNGRQFLARLEPFLKKLTGVVRPPGRTPRFVVEIRNQAWLDEPLLSLLREHKVALALTDHAAAAKENAFDFGRFVRKTEDAAGRDEFGDLGRGNGEAAVTEADQHEGLRGFGGADRSFHRSVDRGGGHWTCGRDERARCERIWQRRLQ